MKKKIETLPAAELSVFCGQVAMFLEAGMPIYEGIRTMCENSGESEYAAVYARLNEQVEQTGALYPALQADPCWPTYLTEMAGIGERAGKLEQVMRSLSVSYEREDRVKEAARSVVAYPLTLGIMLAAVIAIMLWKVVPIFKRVLGSMGLGSGGTADTLSHTGTIIGVIVLILVGFVLLTVIVTAILLKTGHRDGVVHTLCSLFRPVRKLNENLNASRVASVLALLLSGGFSAEEALTLAKTVTDGEEAAGKTEKILTELQAGKGMAAAIEASGLFDPLYMRMFKTAAAAGREAETMEKIAAGYEERVEASMRRLISIIEPTLVAILSAIVGGVLLAVMLPMAGILTGLM